MKSVLSETRGSARKVVLSELSYSADKGVFYDAYQPYVMIPDQLFPKGYSVMLTYAKNALMSIRTTSVSDVGGKTLSQFAYEFNPARVTRTDSGATEAIFTAGIAYKQFIPQLAWC